MSGYNNENIHDRLNATRDEVACKAPTTKNGFYRVYMDSQGYLVHKDILGNVHAVSGVSLYKMSYDNIKLYIAMDIRHNSGAYTIEHARFAIDLAEYVCKNRIYKF